MSDKIVLKNFFDTTFRPTSRVTPKISLGFSWHIVERNDMANEFYFLINLFKSAFCIAY